MTWVAHWNVRRVGIQPSGLLMRIPTLSILLAAALTCTQFTAPAQATQRERVFVASYGSDANPCTFGSPCKTFGQAVSVVAAGGEVTAIDSAGFGSLNISKAITITGPAGVEAGIVVSGNTTGISVTAGPNDTVVLSGLTLEGGGSGGNGIAFKAGGRLEVINCTIRGFTGTGMYVQTPAPALVLVSNTVIADGGYGVYLDPQTGGTVQAAFDHVTANNNNTGIYINATNGTVESLIANSHLDNNFLAGVFIEGANTNAGNAVLKNVTLNQEPNGILLNQNANVWLSRVTQATVSGFANSVGVSFAVGGTGNFAYSDGTNHMMGGYANGTAAAWGAQ
jgi:hypothetical protein